MKIFVGAAFLAGAVDGLVAARPLSFPAPSLYNSTDELANFFNGYGIIPGLYTDLYWSMESLLLGEGRLGPYQPVGVVPSGYYQSAAKLEVHNGSTGYLSSDYVNSTVDHFAMNFWSAGCNVHAATSPHPGGTSPPTLPIPANCTIKVEGPEITLNYNLPSATMENYTFPKTFYYLDKFVMTATLDNIPPNIGIFYTGNGSAYDPSSGIQLLFTDVDYDISRLQITG